MTTCSYKQLSCYCNNILLYISTLTTIGGYGAVVPGRLGREAPNPVLQLARIATQIGGTVQLRVEIRMKEKVWFVPGLAALSHLGSGQLTSVALSMV